MTFTILGSSGFIGSHLKRHLENLGHACLTEGSLGHVIYCAGLTADFRSRPFDTIKAHVSDLVQILREGTFESFLYLSSTRVYQDAYETNEGAQLKVNPLEPGDLYNLSKLMGESACFAAKHSKVRVARLSNIVGENPDKNNFLDSLLDEAAAKKHIVLRSALTSEKDYLSIADLVNILPQISLHGTKQIYNVASGFNTTHAALVDVIQRMTGCTYEVAPSSPEIKFPLISIYRLKTEFDFKPRSILETLYDSDRSR